MVTYPLVSGVPTGYNYAAKPLDNYGQWFDGSNMNIRQYADLFTTSNLTIPPVITNLYNGAGLAVSSKFFGLTWQKWPALNAANIQVSRYGVTLDQQGFTPTTVRSHDHNPSGLKSLRWHHIELTKGVFDWTVFDNWVDTHFAAGRDLLFVVAFPPATLAPAGTGTSSYDNGAVPSSANRAPINMADVADFVTAIYNRRPGKIKWFSCWNEINQIGMYDDTATKYAQMLRTMSQTLKALDPTIKILAPVINGVTSAARTVFSNILAASDGAGGTGATGAGAEKWIDVADFHFYYEGPTLYNAFAADLAAFKAILTANGLGGVELWCTEIGLKETQVSHSVTLAPLTEEAQRQRLVLRMLYQLAVGGISRAIWYSMDSTLLSPFYYSTNLTTLRALINQHVDYLVGGQVTLINQLADQRLAVTAAAQNFLI